ncbi:MAG: 3-hydroxyacyl-CoA dehydrogenase [Kordiimonas sp.]|nr:3-hydroxyacyl-CoA dehydrogenase [Kordiimonas sp.]
MEAERSITDHHFIITGGAGGIGGAVADQLAAAGARLSLMGRTAENLRLKAQSLPQAVAIVCDITDEAQVQNAVEEARKHCGPLHGVINAAGEVKSASIAKTSPSLLREMMEVHVTGPFLVMQATMTEMQTQGYGRIINVASTAALRGYDYTAAYTAAKHGLLGLSRVAALELAGSGVTINTICPGFVQTGLLDRTIAQLQKKTGQSAAQLRQAFAAKNTGGTLLQPQDVAMEVMAFCRPDAHQRHGEVIEIPRVAYQGVSQ